MSFARVLAKPRKIWNKVWKGERFNGLLRTEHLSVALSKFGPLNADQLWEKIKDVSGIESKRKMKLLLQWMKEENRVFTRRNNIGASRAFLYHLNSYHKRNAIEIPENYPEGLEKIPGYWAPPTPKEKLNQLPKILCEEMFPQVFPEAKRPKIRWKKPAPPEGLFPKKIDHF